MPLQKYRLYGRASQDKPVPYSRLVTEKSENMRAAILDIHRQIRWLV
jgi:hypothetical protein